MRSVVSGHLALAASVVIGLVVAACGDGGQGPGPQVPPSPSGSSGPTPPGTGSGNATIPTPPSSGSASTPTPPAPMGPMKSISGSAMADDIKKIGLDPMKPVPFNKMTPDQIRKLMGTFQKSLGVKCDFCHDTNDFKAWTPKKHMAANMWQHFVVDLRMDDGTALYCDSCHQGKPEFLDRADKKALSGWMDANYVKKLKRADKKDHSCEQCHGDPFEPKFLAGWAK